ncbi:hypothetical protein MUK42_34519 [Musa troglodytarum]|uniref:Uncharacterized protein n=1 Tax=Musa troglodytarum TaxID=320322 RepID=A0A9E7FMM9_9LILI|nr:hypothetical protein MUK42_34519 [Musa troglodytarum]
MGIVDSRCGEIGAGARCLLDSTLCLQCYNEFHCRILIGVLMLETEKLTAVFFIELNCTLWGIYLSTDKKDPMSRAI